MSVIFSYLYLDVIDGKVRSFRFVDSPEKCDVKFELVVFSCLVLKCPPRIFAKNKAHSSIFRRLSTFHVPVFIVEVCHWSQWNYSVGFVRQRNLKMNV